MMTLTPIPTMLLPSGEAVPILGQGTWGMGEDSRKRTEEAAALRFGIDLWMTLIDTAEMYGEGGTEELLAEAFSGHRDEVFVVSQFYPHQAAHQGMIVACERSLKHLKTDRLDLYLLHWRGSVPLQETVAGVDALVRVGKIRYWGISNFDLGDIEALASLPMGSTVATNQVLYNLLLALAWLLRQEGIMVIPKASRPEYIHENRRALEIHLADDDVTELDRAFPPPNGPSALAMR